MSEITRRLSCSERTLYNILSESAPETETGPEDRNGSGEENDVVVDVIALDTPRHTLTLEEALDHLAATMKFVVACDHHSFLQGLGQQGRS